jgi:chromosomal replication initiator protein
VESMNARQLWQAVLADLEGGISRNAFANWFANTSLTSVNEDLATVTAPHAFAASTLQARYTRQVERSLGDILGRPVRVTFTTSDRAGMLESAPADPEVPTSVAPREPTASPPAGRPFPRNPSGSSQIPLVRNRQLELTASPASGLNARLIFDTYVVGSSNRLAHAAALAVADNPGGQFNPLFVHGGVGLGKTHLLHAIGHRALEINPELTVMYVTSETFTNDVINDIRSGRMDDFRARYRRVDILMIDDIQFIAGKESTQEEFFHTFNALHQNGKHIIISSDRPPRAIAALEDRMRSRFDGGLVADVQSPDYEMRIAILGQKADDLGIRLPSDVVEYVARKDQTNIRELEGALNRILMLAQLHQKPVALPLAIEALSDSAIGLRSGSASATDVIDTVASHFGVTHQDLTGRSRRREISLPRQVAMYLMREETGSSLVDIGRTLGGRDHTTILHGIEKVEHDLGTDPELRSRVTQIREALLTGSRP